LAQDAAPESIAVYLPISQFVQVVCAVTSVNESLSQLTQAGRPGKLWCLPGGQGKHEAWPVVGWL
jgi:hypothetical protein